jgi:Ig-like domain from next to BRCA1 gene
VLSALIVLSLLAGCEPATPAASAPLVSLLSPGGDAVFRQAELIPVQVAAASSAGIAAIEVSLGSSTRQTAKIDPPELAPSVSLTLLPIETGKLNLAVVAIDSTGRRSEPSISSIVVGAIATPQPAPGLPTGCQLAAQFVSDVSIPDGTPVQAGAQFVKTWRLRNNSGCDWPAGFQLHFYANEPMDGKPSAPLPALPRDSEFDISVTLTAPSASGMHTSTWRLRDLTGISFGNRVFAVITVP